jgi:hypothetical protein
LGRPSARRRFEADWTTPLHHAYRWTAISLSACATHAVVAGMFGIEYNVWSPVVAALLMLAAIALLTGARVFGLPVAAAALIAYGASTAVPIPHLAIPGGLSSAGGSDAWCFFLGGASSVAWMPALAIALGACTLAAPEVAKRYLTRTSAVLLLLFAGVGMTFGGVAIAQKYAIEREEEAIRAAALRHRLEVEKPHAHFDGLRCLVIEKATRPSKALIAVAQKIESHRVSPGPSCLGRADETVILSISKIERMVPDQATVTIEGWCPGCSLGATYQLRKESGAWRVVDTKVLWAG